MNKHLLKLTKKISLDYHRRCGTLLKLNSKSNQKVICIDNLFSGNLKNIKKFLKIKFYIYKKNIRKIINKNLKLIFIHLA